MKLPNLLRRLFPQPPPPPPPPAFSVQPSVVLTAFVGGLLLWLLLRTPSGSTFISQVYKKLFTSEDTFNMHKTLGIACLASYIYRFAHVGSADMNFTTGPWTLVTIALHLLLSVSSLIFRIPVKRIVGGYRIWPEYRLHSIMFAARSLAGMLLTWYELRHGLEPNYLLNVAIVLGTIVAADLSSMSMGPPGTAGRSSTIQDLDAGPATRFFFSVMQFHATMGNLVGVRRFSVMFVHVWVIQFNAFLMTIRRKNLAPHSALVTTYGLMLTFGFCVACHEQIGTGALAMVNTLANLAAVLRLGLRMPKYPLWIGIAVLTYLARPTIAEGSALAAAWPYAWAASVAAVLAAGAHKISKAHAVVAKPKTVQEAALSETPIVGGTPATSEYTPKVQ
eukprot:CAMPEP_0174738914 /NCGR_PEP_ID=MMETSP1094-20130205/70687_1 /TAXON_ID=156173 /ORGANISM="Chrysochromulina brevifilum, Strain UTEX LB 985" /LENGTH=390 /DNA_ID=CAMNT_0015942409 /DNA_START=13 /DNA_END=1185 /DNA_ORIENTATION=-